MKKKVLLLDAYDSFVYIIEQYLLEMGCDTLVIRHDKLKLADVYELRPDSIFLGPGPGRPEDAHYVPVIKEFEQKLPIMGICLGHQAIGLAYGANVVRAKHIMHGKSSEMEHDGLGCFSGMPEERISATRYHSLIIEEPPTRDTDE